MRLVATAVSDIARTSDTVRASGFSQYTWRPLRIAMTAQTAWVWSGVATTTASMSFCSSIFRKSV